MRLRVRSRWRVGIAFMVLLGLVFVAGWRLGSARAAAEGGPGTVVAPAAPPLVVVGPGDTLWDIACRFAPSGTDPRFGVFELRQRNGLASAWLRVGQQLALPERWLPPGLLARAAGR